MAYGKPDVVIRRSTMEPDRQGHSVGADRSLSTRPAMCSHVVSLTSPEAI